MPRIPRPVYTFLNHIVPKTDQSVVVYSVPAFDDTARSLARGLRSTGRRVHLVSDKPSPAVREAAREAGVEGVSSKGSVAALWRFLRARNVFMTHDLNRGVSPRRQTVVNVWHGELGKDVGRWSGDAPVRSTHATALSKLGAAYRCAEFGLSPGHVLIVGHPRNDVMLRADAADVRQRVGLTEQQKLVVWLPTLRHAPAGEGGGDPLQRLLKPAESLDESLARNDIVVLLKSHPLTPAAESVTSGRRWFVGDAWLAERGVSVYELLGASDGLITDTSSAWVDYLLLDRPVWIHFPDPQHTAKEWRASLEPFEAWAPGAMTTDLAALGDELDTYFCAGDDRFGTQRTFLRKVLHRYDDAHATDRLLHALGLV
jgi:CDP-glycerol glycerophosphotransferase (TagB/SpsB family)